MGAAFKSPTPGVPGCKSQRMQGENKAFTARWNFTEQTSSSQENDGQGSQSGRGVAGKISESEEGSSHCGINFRGFQSRKESPDNCKVGISLKEGTIRNTHVQEPARISVPRQDSCCRSTPSNTDVVILDDDTDSGVSTCEVTSSTEEEEDDDMHTEMNNGYANYDAELDSDDVDTESDCSSCDNVCFFYQHTPVKNPNSRKPLFCSADVSDNEDDCLVYEPCSHSQLNSRSTKRKKNITTSGYYRYISESDSDSSDCEILEGSYGEIRQKWEEAVMMKRVSQGIRQKNHGAGAEVHISGSNLETDSPVVEGGPEVTTNWKEAGFTGCNTEDSLRNLSNFDGESGMNAFSHEIDVASFGTSTELDTCNLSGVNISDRVVLEQDTNDINMHTGAKELNKGRMTETRNVDTLGNAQHQSHGEENQNLIATCSIEVPKKQLFIDENVTKYISNREKLKETLEFRLADQEEWAHRQLELRRQAEEVQRLRRKRKAEALRIQEMEQRQKRRLEEIRITQKKDEQTMDLKEQLRDQVRSRLEEVASSCKDMVSLLRCLGIPVEGGPLPSSQQVNAAYKKALLRFHPDRASVSNGDLHYQVEAEETFKMISRLKDTLLPIAASYGSKTYW